MYFTAYVLSLMYTVYTTHYTLHTTQFTLYIIQYAYLSLSSKKFSRHQYIPISTSRQTFCLFFLKTKP